MILISVMFETLPRVEWLVGFSVFSAGFTGCLAWGWVGRMSRGSGELEKEPPKWEFTLKNN